MRGCPCQGLVFQHSDISRPPLLRIQESVRLRALAPMHLRPGGEAEPHHGKQFLHSVLWPVNAVSGGAEKWDAVLEHGAGISAPLGIPALAVKSARGPGSQATARTASAFSKEGHAGHWPGPAGGARTDWYGGPTRSPSSVRVRRSLGSSPAWIHREPREPEMRS